MQLFEVKDNMAKIDYNPSENNLLPSDFLLIEDSDKKIIAQVVNILPTENPNTNMAEVNFSLFIDEEDNLSYYNGFVPSQDSLVIYVQPEEIINLIKDSENNIYFGNLTNHKDCFVTTSMAFINDKCHILSDRDDKTKILIQNITSELYSKNNMIILIDFDGRYNSILNVERFKFTEDFKLPLNIEAFNVMLNNDLGNCTKKDRDIIENIIFELKEYLATLKEGYIPFSVFKEVIESELESNTISGLKLFNEKLNIYQKQNLFTENTEDAESLNEKLINKKILIIDATKTDEKWHGLILDTISKIINIKTYIVLSLNDSNINKESINNLYANDKIIPIVSTNYENSINDILKPLCKNNILFKPSKPLENKEIYANILNKINTGDFVLYGDSTLFLSLVVELQPFDASTSENVIQNEIKQDVDKLLSPSSDVIQAKTEINKEIKQEIIDDKDINDEDLDFLDEENSENNPSKYNVFEPLKEQKQDLQETETTEKESESENIQLTETDDTQPDIKLENESLENELLEIEPLENESKENEPEKNTLQENENLPSEPEIINTTDEKPEDEAQVNSVNDKIELLWEEDINNTDTEPTNQEPDTILDEVTNDIQTRIEADTAKIEENNIKSLQDIIETEENKENKENKENENDQIIINNTQKNETKLQNTNPKEQKKLPIYETDDSNSSIMENELPFKIGDKVYHPKHGNGVIEGFANYSNKILFCQVEFENVGRRILDPRISGLEKIS